MRKTSQVFHLAIPCGDLDKAKEFYVDQLGCELARRYDDRITLNFFGDQVVCHLAPDQIDEAPKMYPRHFGITFADKDDFEELLANAKSNDATFFKDDFVRFEGRQEEHRTFFLIDPSNNLLEFKYCNDTTMMY